MSGPRRRLLVPGAVLAASAAALAAAAVALYRHCRPAGIHADGGVLIADASSYDRFSGWLFGSFYTGIADDIATAFPAASVLDVGCGTGHLLERLADRGLTVTGLDLDPAMIDRAQARLGSRAALVAADVARMPFADASFDVVTSTLSMHHWDDHAGGLAEIARVLRPGGRALIYDLGGGLMPLHTHVDGPAHHVAGSALELLAETPWRWPGPISLVRRVEARRQA